MKAKKFKSKMESLIDKMNDLISEMPYQGNSESESQKVCLTNALYHLSQQVNGVENSDFKPSKDY